MCSFKVSHVIPSSFEGLGGGLVSVKPFGNILIHLDYDYRADYIQHDYCFA